MQQHVSFSHLCDPNNWGTPAPVAVKFTGNIAKWLSDARNVADLDAVLAGKAIIVRLNPKAT
jgi:hypothetical protein